MVALLGLAGAFGSYRLSSGRTTQVGSTQPLRVSVGEKENILLANATSRSSTLPKGDENKSASPGHDFASGDEDVALTLTGRQLRQIQDLLDQGHFQEAASLLGLRITAPGARRNSEEGNPTEATLTEDQARLQLENLARVIDFNTSNLSDNQLKDAIDRLRKRDLGGIARMFAVDPESLSSEQFQNIAEITGISVDSLASPLPRQSAAFDPVAGTDSMAAAVESQDPYARLRESAQSEGTPSGSESSKQGPSYFEQAAMSRQQ